MTLIKKAYWQKTDEEIIEDALEGIQDDLRRQGYSESEVDKVRKTRPHFHQGFYIIIKSIPEGSMAFAKKRFMSGKVLSFESPLMKSAHAAGNAVKEMIDTYIRNQNKSVIIKV